MKKLLDTFKNIWAIDELKSKIIVTLLFVLTYRIGAQITLPGINPLAIEAAQKAGIKLLEPIMKVEVVSPEEYLGDVIGDMNSRRGQIQGTDSRGNAQVVESMVPLANMFGYVNQLRSFTQGRANYSMFFNHYDEVPSNVAAEIKEKLA